VEQHSHKKQCRQCKVEKSLEDFYNSKKGKFGKEAKCKSCMDIIASEWRKNNLDVVNAGQKRRAVRYKTKRKEAQKIWRKENAAKLNAKNMLRYAAKKQATPVWSDIKKIERIYIFAKAKENLTGIKMHVDHIIPLQSNTVCGLHVENNLQLLSAVDNIRKGNKLYATIIGLQNQAQAAAEQSPMGPAGGVPPGAGAEGVTGTGAGTIGTGNVPQAGESEFSGTVGPAEAAGLGG